MNTMLSTHEAAPLVGVAPKTLENWRTLGRGPTFVKAGGRVVYDPADIEIWKSTRRSSSTSGLSAV